jgi:hypothetical protein
MNGWLCRTSRFPIKRVKSRMRMFLLISETQTSVAKERQTRACAPQQRDLAQAQIYSPSHAWKGTASPVCDSKCGLRKIDRRENRCRMHVRTSERAPYGTYLITNGARDLTEVARRSVSESPIPTSQARGISVFLASQVTRSHPDGRNVTLLTV